MIDYQGVEKFGTEMVKVYVNKIKKMKNYFKQKLTRDKQDKMIAGVCSGIANYFNIDPVITRLIFIVGTVSVYPFFLLYILLWIIAPYGKESKKYTFKNTLKRDKQSKMIGGVCSGISNYFEIDPMIIRLIFVVGMFSAYPFFLLYIVLWIITPYETIEFKENLSDKYSDE